MLKQNLLLTILSLLLHVISWGQFAVVNDKDGFVNIRESAKTGAKVIDKLKNGHLLFLFEGEGNWTNVDYSTDNNHQKSGYVYRDRYTLVSDYPNCPVKKQTSNSIVLSKDSLEVMIIQQKFDKQKHRFNYVKEAQDLIELIDNKPYYGRDGAMPDTEYSRIQVIAGTTKIDLPKEALTNLYEPNLATMTAHHDIKNNIVYIMAFNGDGAGAYCVIWKIEKGVYKERFITAGF